MKHMLFAAIIATGLLCGAAGADEAKMRAGMPGAMPGMAMHQQKHEMMLEGQQIILQSIQLMKEMAQNPQQKAKAEALEQQLTSLIKKHDDMHAQMMKRMQECETDKGKGMHHHKHMMEKPQAPAKQ